MLHGCSRRRSAKVGREFLQPIDVVRLADERESQLAGLGEVVVVNLQALDRFEFSREQIEHLGVERHARDENVEAERGHEHAPRARRGRGVRVTRRAMNFEYDISDRAD